MGAFTLPQNEKDKEARQKFLDNQPKIYEYVDKTKPNYKAEDMDIGLPLMKDPGPADANQADWALKIFTLFLKIRTNEQAIYDKTGYDFMTPKPVRDIPRFVEVLKSKGNIQDYFIPDPGFIQGDASMGRAKSINDYTDKVFVDRTPDNKGTAPLPDMAKVWDKDETFAYNFLAGPNPNQVKRYTLANKPADFDLTDFDLGSIPGFEGDQIGAAIAAGRVYIVDHSDMKELFANLPGAPAPNAAPRTFNGVRSADWKYVYAPYAAFAVPPGGNHMMPIAIQCGPKADGHQIYTPKDGYSWKMARACVLAAHNNHHEVVSHLGLTHLLMDPIVMATRLHLHPDHPIYQLLSPHFEGTADINHGARTSLILPEKSVDRLVGSKIEMNYPYLLKNRFGHSFRKNFIPTRFEAFGINDTRLLPNYPYREDSLLIWNAIRNWVSEYVAIWYTKEGDIQADFELQRWANEINTKGRVLDFCLPGVSGVRDRDDLIDMLTMTIFTCGPQHAAVNFPQGSEMLFIPANPMAGYAQAPQGLGHSEKDFLAILPPLDVAVHSWAILSTLAGVNNTRLGDYRGAFNLHPKSELARQGFLGKLRAIEEQIKAANKTRRSIYNLEYVHLLPSRIPASINI